ncbi:hypothetical protein CYFUS_009020 [Cystobacter fuscus]|uniref:Aerolysin-like C-terminal domain-containing protein n=1 Tax=Cystobacter fuscus TaxID=43 RepID=A0A250JIR9_9BACT|nr:hypothetical protein CYFUS_009020 [Cystobacter fuscus]
MSKKRIDLLYYRTQSESSYSAQAQVAFTIKLEGHLRSVVGNGHVNHPTDEAPFSVSFGDNTRSGFEDILDKYNHRQINGYPEWDWSWMRINFSPVLDEVIPFFDGGVAIPISGKFSKIAGGITYIKEYPAEPL